MSTSICRKGLFVGLTLSLFGAVSVVQAAVHQQVSASHVSQALENKGFPFIKNHGQQHSDVAFYTNVPGGVVFVDREGALVYSIGDAQKRWAFKEQFVSTQKLIPSQSGSSGMSLKVQGKDVVSTDRLSLGEIAKGVRVELQARANNVEKLFYIQPGADTDAIRVQLDGLQGSQLNEQGQLVVKTGLGDIAFSKPVAFQQFGNEKRFVDVAYVLNDNRYGFKLGAYDASRELVIDPLIAATYIGGGDGYPTYSYDSVEAVVSAGEYVYVAGGTHAPDFPTALGYDSTFDGIRQGFVLRMSADLSSLLNATFIGGTVYDMLINASGEIVVAGQAYAGFPSTGDVAEYPSTGDRTGGFVARFSQDLTQLNAAGVVVTATIKDIAEGNNALYFVGRHNINNLPVTANALQSSCNCESTGSYSPPPYDGFLGKLSSDFSTLDALTWISGDSPTDVAVGTDSSVYVTDFAFTVANGNIRQFDADITSVLASHSFAYLGNSQTTFDGVEVGDGFVLAGGTTRKNNLPVTANAYDTTCGSDGTCDGGSPDGFLVRYSSDLQTIEGLTYFGGSGNDAITGIALDEAGNVLMGGYAGSGSFPTTADAYDSKTGGRFIARMSADLSALKYSTRFSVSGSLAPASGTGVYLYGSLGSSTEFPATKGAFDTTYNGGASDGFVVLFDTGSVGGGSDPGPDPVPSDNVSPIADAGEDQTVATRSSVTLDGSNSSDSDGSVVAYQWRQLEGKSVRIDNAANAVASFEAPRLRRGRPIQLVFELTVTDNDGASSSDQVTVVVE